ncbi:hypothetical protein [Streptomyces uncialis]|uniref:hypothetical protein n=1 Tax=Streptomyces uncialis TaxID=1048205 RepID=UPI0033D2AF9C
MHHTTHPTEQQHAAAAVGEALSARGLWALQPGPTRAPDTPGRIEVVLADTGPFSLAGTPMLPLTTADQAAALEAALRAADITATAENHDEHIPRSARITFHTPGDAHRFADLVWAEMPAGHRAVHRLSTALARAGITSGHMRLTHTGIGIGRVTARDALTLIPLLGGPHHPRLRPRKQADLKKIAASLRYWLRRLLPGIRITTDPACSSCLEHRDHELVIGDAPVDDINTLAGALETAPPAQALPQPAAGPCGSSSTRRVHPNPGAGGAPAPARTTRTERTAS